MEDQLRPIIDENVIRDAYRISYLANFFTGPLYVDIEAKYGLTRPEAIILIMLAQVSELTAKDICQVSGRPKNSISRAVHKLLKRGFVKRTADKEDGRRWFLTITDRGMKVYEAFIPSFMEREEMMLGGLTAAERKTLDRLLTKLINHSENWAHIY